MTEQQACTLCGAGGHTAAQCSMAMDLIRHIAGLYSGKAIKGDFTQVYITGNEIWMAQQILAAQQGEQATSAEIARVHHERAEAAQGGREAATAKFAETCPMTAESAAGGNSYDIELRRYYLLGWDDRANLAQPSPARELPLLKVMSSPMPESNGKSNFTAILMRDGGDICDGFTIARSEYPDRVRYEADCVRWLIGELPEKPFILDYDADKHSGYKAPASQAGQVPEEVRILLARAQGQIEHLAECTENLGEDLEDDYVSEDVLEAREAAEEIGAYLAAEPAQGGA